MPMRRLHTKSRTGCKECKRRRVKCDESRPSCFNCSRYGSSCEFPSENRDGTARPSAHRTSGRAVPSLRSSAAKTVTSNERRQRTPDIESDKAGTLDQAEYNRQQRHISPSNDHYVNSPSFIDPSLVSTSNLCLEVGLDEMKARDFELMHHFCTATWSTMGMREDMRQVWRVVIPQEGYAHPFLMHGILALSALHKAYLLPDKRLRYLTLGAHHYTCGQGVYRKLMANVTDENWRPIFCFALILIAYVRSLPATRSEEYAIEDPVLVILELFCMIRGLKAILSPYTLRFRKTNLSPLATAIWFVEEEDITDANLSLEFSPLPSNTFEVLADLRFFMRSQVNLANREDIDEAISKLRIMAVQVAESGTNIEFGTFMIWPYFLPDTIVLDIKEKRPHALVVLAYFIPFLAILERDYWFFKGMGRNLLNQIDACLEDHSALRVYLDWPKAHS